MIQILSTPHQPSIYHLLLGQESRDFAGVCLQLQPNWVWPLDLVSCATHVATFCVSSADPSLTFVWSHLFCSAISTVVNDAASKKSAEALGVTLHDDASNLPSSSLLAGLRAAQWTSMAFGAAAFVICIAFLRSVQVLGHRRKIKGSEIEPKALEEDKVEPLDEAGDPNTGTDGVDTTSLEFKSRV